MCTTATMTRKEGSEDGAVCTWLGESFLNTHETMRSNAVVARSGRPHSVAREPLQDTTMRSGRLAQAIREAMLRLGGPLIRQAAERLGRRIRR